MAVRIDLIRNLLPGTARVGKPDVALMDVDAEAIDRQLKSRSLDDTRDAAALERIWTLRTAEITADKQKQNSAEKEAAELLRALDDANEARSVLAEAGESDRELLKVDTKISGLSDRWAAALDTAEKAGRIAKARSEQLDRWLKESVGGVTNLQLIESSRKKAKALAAV
jgi:hypothetical protein